MEVKMPEVTPDDILRGSKEVEVELVRGGTLRVTINAVPWRTALVAANCHPAEAMIQTLTHSLPKEQRTDEFLDRIKPVGLMQLFNVAMQLKNGAPKKTEAKGATLPPPSPSTSTPSAP